MSTNASVTIYNADSQPIAHIYKHWDGYPDELGVRLQNLCAKYRLTNGVSLADDRDTIANGMECLAARIVHDLKDGPGDIYLADYGRQEFNYHIRAGESHAVVTCDEETLTEISV